MLKLGKAKIKMRLFLDNNSTTQLRSEVKNSMVDSMDVFGNPSSIHYFGQEAKTAIEEARRNVADMLNVRAEQVVFNSGGTEGNVTAIKGIMALHPGKRIVSSPTEHSSVFNTVWAMQQEGFEGTFLTLNNDGLIDLEELELELAKCDVGLVSIMFANNETGVIQPVNEIAKLCKRYNVPFHCDAVQGAGKLKLDFNDIGADALTIAFHKFGGPKGVGALVLNPDLRIREFLTGGGQERGRRSGTENTMEIVGAGEAAKAAMANYDNLPVLEALRAKLETGLKEITPDIEFASVGSKRMGNTCMAILPNMESQMMIMAMDMENIAVSAGSACSSGKVSPSRILVSMGYDVETAKRGLRISFGWQNNEADVDAFLAAYKKINDRIEK